MQQHTCISLYVHLPWCIKKCPYCDFNSHPLGDTIAPTQAYTQAIINDLLRQCKHFNLQQRSLLSIFFGGGTPSLFAAQHIGAIIATASRLFAIQAQQLEITLEVNPGTSEQHNLAAYREVGVNRLSIGAQSFNNTHLQQLGRIHNSEEIEHTIKQATASGFQRINIDLMYGLPAQSLQQAQQDVNRALNFAVDHLSYYQLTLEENTRFHHQPPPHLPDAEKLWAMQQQAETLLVQHGYQQYEISAWAKQPLSQSQCQHNLNYWRFGDYIGVGAGAHGKISQTNTLWRSRHAQSPNRYMSDIQQGKLPLQQTVALADRSLEFALNQLRLFEGFSVTQFQQRTGVSIDSILPILIRARQQQLLDFEIPLLSTSTIHVSQTGHRYLNDLQALFLH